MGICLQNIKTDGPKSMSKPLNIDTGFIWVVVRREEQPVPEHWPENCNPPEAKWHIQGVFFYEETAAQACRNEQYFIGPLPVNTALPHRVIEWVGAYFPLKKP